MNALIPRTCACSLHGRCDCACVSNDVGMAARLTSVGVHLITGVLRTENPSQPQGEGCRQKSQPSGRISLMPQCWCQDTAVCQDWRGTLGAKVRPGSARTLQSSDKMKKGTVTLQLGDAASHMYMELDSANNPDEQESELPEALERNTTHHHSRRTGRAGRVRAGLPAEALVPR